MKIASGTSLLLTLFCFAKPYDCLADTCSVRNTFLETCPKFDIGDYAKNTIRSVILEQQSVERETRMVNVRARVGTERLVNNRRIVDSDSRISNFPAKSANNDRANNIINRDFRRSAFTDRSRVVNDNRIRESVERDSNTRSYLTRDSRREIFNNARMLTTRNNNSPNQGDIKRIVDTIRNIRESNADLESRIVDIKPTFDNRRAFREVNSDRESRIDDSRHTFDNQRERRELTVDRESRADDTQRAIRQSTVDRETRTIDRRNTVDNRRRIRELNSNRKSRVVDARRNTDNRRVLRESNSNRETRNVDASRTLDTRRTLRESSIDREFHTKDIRSTLNNQRVVRESSSNRESRNVDARLTFDNRRTLAESNVDRESRLLDIRSSTDNQGSHSEANSERETRNVDARRILDNQRAGRKLASEQKLRMVDTRRTSDNRRALHESFDQEFRTLDKRSTVDNRRVARESTADRESRIVDITRTYDNRRALPESTVNRKLRIVDRRTTVDNRRAGRESTADRESRIVDTTHTYDNRRALPESTIDREFRIVDKRTTVDNLRAVRESTTDRASRIIDTRRTYDNRRSLSESNVDRESRTVGSRSTVDNREARELTVDRESRMVDLRERVEIRLNKRKLPTNRVLTKSIRKIDSFTDVTRDSRELPNQARSVERDQRFRIVDRTTSSTRNLQARNINLKDTDRKTIDRISIRNIKTVSNEGSRESVTERRTMERNSQIPIQERRVIAKDSRFASSRQPEIKNVDGRSMLTENRDRRDQRSNLEIRESRNSVDNRRFSDRTGQLYQRLAGSSRIAEEISNKGERKVASLEERLLTDVRLAERVRERVQTTSPTFERRKSAEAVRDTERRFSRRSREVSRRDSRIRETLLDRSSVRALREYSAIREDRTERVNDDFRISERRTAVTNRKTTETFGRQARISNSNQIDDRKVVDRNLQDIASRIGRMSSDDRRSRSPGFNDYFSTKDENNNERLQVNERHSNFYNDNDMMGKKTISYTTWSNIVTTVLSVLLFAHMIGTSADFKKYQYFTSYFNIAKEKIF